MSWKATNAVTEHSKHSGSELLCLLMLANRADENGGNIFPSMSTLARDCRMSRRGVQYIMARLLESGELVQTGTFRRGVKTYRIVLPPWDTPRPVQTLRTSPVQNSARPVQNSALTCATVIAHKRYERSIERKDRTETMTFDDDNGNPVIIERWRVSEAYAKNGIVYFGDGSVWENPPAVVRNNIPGRT